jgi:hypothetical protein
MRLYKIEWSGVAYAVAEDEAGAVKAARDGLREYGEHPAGVECSARPVRAGEAVPEFWRAGLPFSERGVPDRTTAEWRDEIPAEG